MMKIELSRGYVALIDLADADQITKYSWHAITPGRNKYAASKFNGKYVYMHRLLLSVRDSKTIVDHINGNGLDNRRANLRLTDKSGNARNMIKIGKYKGIWWHKKNKKWCAEIKVSYKKIGLGSFHDEISAARAYNEAAIKYFGEFARLNILKDGDINEF